MKGSAAHARPPSVFQKGNGLLRLFAAGAIFDAARAAGPNVPFVPGLPDARAVVLSDARRRGVPVARRLRKARPRPAKTGPQP